MRAVVLISWLALCTSCSILGPQATYRKAMVEATAQRWAGGARGSNRGVIFSLKFYKLPQTLQADTLLVNGVPLPAEVSNVADTTYVTATYSTNATEIPSLANAPTYSGQLALRINAKKYALNIKSFKILATLNYP